MTSSNENILALLALCAVNSPVTGEFPSQRQVTRSFDIYLISAYINGWLNYRETGDFSRHCAHFSVTVMRRTAHSVINYLYNGWAPNRREVIVWANVGLIYWRIYALLGID